MSGASRALRAFSTRDLVLIAVLAALGIAIKPVVVPIAHLIAAPLLIPGGAFAGGLYMLWLVVGMAIVGKRGTATLIALVQALLVMFTGVVGSHGAMSLVSYTAPGIVMDLGLLVVGHRACCLPCCFLAGVLANVTGTLMVSFIFFNLPPIPLALALCTAALSGGVGGAVAWQIIKLLRRYHIGIAAGSASALLTVALVAALMLTLSGCSSSSPATGAESRPAVAASATAGIPITYGTTDVNGRLSAAELFKGPRNGPKTMSLAASLAAAGGKGARRASIYKADGSVEHVAVAACSLSSNGSLAVGGKGVGAVVGIVLDPPNATVGDVYRMARKNLESGKKTLVVYLDGFGYDQYVLDKREGDIPNMARLVARKAVTVYPTITPVTFASMVSGTDPAATGVHDRVTHRLSCPTIYTWAESHGKKTSLIEGNLQILDLTRNTVLNSDENGNGLTDDEVFAAAKRRLASGQPDFMLVHLHGIDDVATSDGPFSASTTQRAEAQDAMVGELLRIWRGQVIVVADHGLHAVPHAGKGESRGHHGDFRSEDLFIPLLVRDAR